MGTSVCFHVLCASAWQPRASGCLSNTNAITGLQRKAWRELITGQEEQDEGGEGTLEAR